jgi:hypothetical protein
VELQAAVGRPRAALIVLCAVAAGLVPGAARAEPPAVAPARAAAALFGDRPPAACADDVRCLIAARYPARPTRALALRLFDELGDVAGLEAAHEMDGGYRGLIHVVPALPTDEHLRRVLGAQREIAAVLAGLERRAGAALPYRHRGLVWRFFRTPKRRTPSAYAIGWEVAYNLAGSLNGTDESVRDTVVHELFHLNDFAHDTWSTRALGDLLEAILGRCGDDAGCLAPYAPMPTKVRKTGMFYAFQTGNGEVANEYAAELATRYFLEQRAALAGARWPAGPFKCQAAENARAWRALADEFFGGVDAVPACR